MQRPILALSVIVCGLFSIQSQADETTEILQTAAFRSEASARSLATSRRPGAPTIDRTLAVSERVRFGGVDPTPSAQISTRIEISLLLDQAFDGVIGDGVPLDEASEPVEMRERVRTRIDVVAPNGSFLFSEVVESEAVRCAGVGICAFSHRERRALRLTFELKPSALAGRSQPTFSIRATTVGGIVAQLCTPRGVWDRCQVRRARITLISPGNGIRLITSPRPPESVGESTASGKKSSVVRRQPDPLAMISGALLLTSVILVARHIWIMRRQRGRGGRD